jgi:hypothetical protein
MALIRHRAMQRFVAGVRAGGDLLVHYARATIGAPSNAVGGSPLGKLKHRRGGQAYRTGRPPYSRSGAGQLSICYQIKEVDEETGKVVLRIGVDASAAGGMTVLRSYLMGHEKGIRYPTRGDRSNGVVLQRPWLEPTIRRYFYEFAATVVMVGRGLA